MINIEKKIHGGLRETFGKFQYIYSSEKGRISLILLKDYFKKGNDIWEIFSGGDLFEDTERFATKKKAEKRISEVLNQ